MIYVYQHVVAVCGVVLLSAYLDGPNGLEQREKVILDELTNVESWGMLVVLISLFMRSRRAGT
jgi:hypothetical protein